MIDHLHTRPTSPSNDVPYRIVVAASLAGTLLLGVWLRWALAGDATLPVPFHYLRHAHSHLGYFGVLFPLAWLGWRAAGARVPGRSSLVVYALSTVLACTGFVVGGYDAVAIVGSTLVAAFWIASAFNIRERMRRIADPLGAVPVGVVASLACVPPVAMNLRTNPDLAHGFVSTFLSGLLLVVVVPSALAGRRVSVGPWPLLLAAGALAALALGVAPNAVTRAGLLAYPALMVVPAAARSLEPHARAAWALVALGLAAMAAGLLPNTRPVALGATHFLVLGAVLGSLAPQWLRRAPPPWAWWCGHACWGTMSAALVVQAFGGGAWTWTAAALGGTATVAWWAGVAALQLRHPR